MVVAFPHIQIIKVLLSHTGLMETEEKYELYAMEMAPLLKLRMRGSKVVRRKMGRKTVRYRKACQAVYRHRKAWLD